MVIVILVDLVLKEKMNEIFFKKENMFSVSKFQVQTQLIEQSLIKHYVLDI